MISMSRSWSHSPNQPCAPNSSTKTRPETTGETEKGSSIKVTSSGLAAKIILGDRPGRGDPEDRVERNRDGRDHQGQLDRRARVGLGHRREPGLPALLERLGQHRAQRQQQHQRDISEAPPKISSALTASRLAQVRRAAHQPVLRRCQCWSRLSTSSMANDTTSITVAIAAAPA